ncbi:MAG TPA: EscU/YscU/HrcU family type III secretion system export apparatus switch protein [Nitrospirota bacterium]|nr:EscU/YscU/HrcU family type III secretion system export apparatus switch protein [Nitrospirota bacterium]
MQTDEKHKLNKAAALQYRKGADSAPAVTAKGRGAVAEKIIDLARKHGVPIREDRNMVEILSTMDLYEEIPPQLYKAVAEILAYIYTMTGKK